jgi:urease accessory protein
MKKSCRFNLKPELMVMSTPIDLSEPTESEVQRSTSNAQHSDSQALLRLLQLVSPALPVGAYSYSEGLETLVQANQLISAETLTHWLTQELQVGAIRLEAAAIVRVYRSVQLSDETDLIYWNDWLSAFRETEELREQSWQMGRSLSRLLLELDPSLSPYIHACGDRCNFAIAFAIAAAHWQIDCHAALLGYLQSWVTNLIGAGVKLIPLGQTAGQKVLLNLYPTITATAEDVLTLQDEAFGMCGWGVAIASMNHETLYSRLFRS